MIHEIIALPITPFPFRSGMPLKISARLSMIPEKNRIFHQPFPFQVRKSFNTLS